MSLENVSFSYRSPFRPWRVAKQVLQDVSFELYPGETLGVIGSNGSGKSTLMKVLSQIVNPDRGTVNVTAAVQLLSLQVGVLPELSGRENCYLSGMLLGKSSRFIDDNIESVIEFSGLHNVFDQEVRSYSSGMRARLGFAVSLMADPGVLLIDEAFSVGDKEFRKKSKQAIEARMASERSFVLVSHSESMLKEYCQRTLWLEEGRVRFCGETELTLAEYRQYNVLEIS